MKINKELLNEEIKLHMEIIANEILRERIDKAIKYIKDRAFDLELPSVQEELIRILNGTSLED